MVTLVENHLYVDADGTATDGEVQAISAAVLASSVGVPAELHA